jgi:hypothetical protein
VRALLASITNDPVLCIIIAARVGAANMVNCLG